MKLVEPIVLIAVPCVLVACALADIDQAAVLTAAVAVAAIAVFLVGWERSRPGLRQIMPTVVLGALAAAGRILFAAFPDVKPVSAICILAGAVFGRRSGFMVGALAALVSNFFFGQGPWTPWQMYAWGMIGYLAGMLADRGLLEKPAVVYSFGFASAFFYGLLLNSWTVVGFVRPLNWETALLTYAAAAPFDLIHAVATVAFLAIVFVPWRRKLERIRAKYGLS